MSSECRAISDGIFTLTESEEPNVLYFYRNDGGSIKGIGRIPTDLLQNYTFLKMMSDGDLEPVINNFHYKIVDNSKIIRVTVS